MRKQTARTAVGTRIDMRLGSGFQGKEVSI